MKDKISMHPDTLKAVKDAYDIAIMTEEGFEEELQKAFRAGHRYADDIGLGEYAQDFDSWYKAIYKESTVANIATVQKGIKRK